MAPGLAMGQRRADQPWNLWEEGVLKPSIASYFIIYFVLFYKYLM